MGYICLVPWLLVELASFSEQILSREGPAAKTDNALRMLAAEPGSLRGKRETSGGKQVQSSKLLLAFQKGTSLCLRTPYFLYNSALLIRLLERLGTFVWMPRGFAVCCKRC